MSSKNIVLILIGVILIYLFMNWTEKKDQKLMELCSDHITQTLYEC